MTDYSDLFFDLRSQVDELEKIVNSLNYEDSFFSEYSRKMDILQHLDYFKKINASILNGDTFPAEEDS